MNVNTILVAMFFALISCAAAADLQSLRMERQLPLASSSTQAVSFVEPTDDRRLTLQVSPAFATGRSRRSLGDDQEAAIALARAGRHEEALTLLESLLKQEPGNVYLLADTVAVLYWAGHAEAAAQLADERFDERTPIYGLDVAALAARDSRRFTEALEYYRRILLREPGNPRYLARRIYVLSDMARHDEALREAESLSQRESDLALSWNALGYALRGAECYPESLAAYGRALRIEAQNSEALQGRILALNKAGAPHLAVHYLDQNPGLFAERDEKRIRFDATVQRLHWEKADTRLRALRYANTQPALSRMDSLLVGTLLGSEADFRADHLTALVQHRDYAEAIGKFEDWQRDDPASIPLYVKQALTDAYQATRQPEKALPLFDELVAAWPKNVDVALGRFYTLVDLERHEEALRFIDALLEPTPVWAYTETPAMERPNEEYIGVRVAQAMERAYADFLPQAMTRMQILRNDLAPSNHEVRNALGTVYLWRGWPDAAEVEWELVRAAEPTSRAARLGLVGSYQARGEWRRAHDMLAELQAEGYEDREFREAQMWARVHDLRQLHVEMGFGKGGADGGRDLYLDAKLYSAPLDERWRAFVHDRESRAWLDPRTIHAAWRGVGIEYVDRNVVLEGEVFGVHPRFGGAHLRVDGRWRLSDHWSVSGGYSHFDVDTPARALENGIRMASAVAGFEWRHSEQRSISGELRPSRFTDGNHRLDAALRWTELLHVDWRNRLYGTASINTQNNSRRDTPYYNPERARDVGYELTWEHLQFRRYEYQMWHRVSFGTGRLWEKRYGASPMYSALYGQRWRFDERTTFDWYLTHSRRSYDGQAENRTGIFLEFDLRF